MEVHAQPSPVQPSNSDVEPGTEGTTTEEEDPYYAKLGVYEVQE